jgi:hypothetical protein
VAVVLTAGFATAYDDPFPVGGLGPPGPLGLRRRQAGLVGEGIRRGEAELGARLGRRPAVLPAAHREGQDDDARVAGRAGQLHPGAQDAGARPHLAEQGAGTVQVPESRPVPSSCGPPTSKNPVTIVPFTGLDALARALADWAASAAGRRKGRRVGFPRFRSRRRARPSVRFTTGAIRVEADWRHVQLPRLGRIHTHESTRSVTRRATPNPRRPARRLEGGTARILGSSSSGWSSRCSLPSVIRARVSATWTWVKDSSAETTMDSQYRDTTSSTATAQRLLARKRVKP